MKKFIYSVRDKKLGAYGAPHFSNEDSEHTVAMVVRGLVRTPSSEIDEVADQALYFLGEFDDISAKFNLLAEPEKLVDYEDYVPRKAEVKSNG